MRMRRHRAALVLLFGLLCLPGVVGSGEAPIRTEAGVITVDDGDSVTLRMQGRRLRARLIGIDAPELGQEPWGRKSREHLRKLLKKSRMKVYVETDVVRYDKYDRLLVYLWTQSGEMVNERMLADGFAVLFTIQPNSRHVERFRKALRMAREGGKGIWGPDGLEEAPSDYKKAHPRN